MLVLSLILLKLTLYGFNGGVMIENRPKDNKYEVGPYNLPAGEIQAGLNKSSKRIFEASFSLANTDTAIAYADGDCLVEIGELDVSPMALGAPSEIIINKAHVSITTAAGITLVGALKLSPTTGTLTNVAPLSHQEFFGAGATYKNEINADASLVEVDINLNAVALISARPFVTTTADKKYLYLTTTTSLDGDATACRGRVVIEYTVI